MKTLKRIKKYKAESPEKTVTNIRTILCEKLGIILEEADFKSEGGFYSTRIKIGNYNLSDLDYGTNGKGMTFSYALASAHGEFMERMQNLAIIRSNSLAYKDSKFIRDNSEYISFLKKNNMLLNYQYAPDEEYVIVTTNNYEDILKNIGFPDRKLLFDNYQGRKLSMLPFYNVTKKAIELLPYEIVFNNCTSNGMCAGNTPKEAIIQGLSEIIERYVVREIYMKGLSLPTIPDCYFSGTEILDKINLLKEKYGENWKFQIKDCSLCKGYPAIGILMLNHVERKYLFHLGVDPSPITALERSLTEIFQGREIAAILDMDYSVQNGMLYDPNIMDAEFYKTCTTGSGHYPITILDEPEDSNFFGFDDSWGISDDKDLKKLIRLIEGEGHEIFIRDVSFLGFPSYCIYVPGITEFRNIIKDNQRKAHADLKPLAVSAALNLYLASKEEMEALATYIENEKKFIEQVMEYDSDSFLIRYDKDLIKGVLYIASENYSKAYIHIKKYSDNFSGTPKEKLFFSALSDMLLCKKEGYSAESMNLLYDRLTIETVGNFIQGKEVLKYVPYASFSNNDWDRFGEKHPSFMGMLQVMKKLEDAYIENIPNQIELRRIIA